MMKTYTITEEQRQVLVDTLRLLAPDLTDALYKSLLVDECMRFLGCTEEEDDKV